MAIETWVKDGGVWREVDPSGFYVKDGGVWREVAEGWAKDGGVWRQVFQKSDPQTYQFNPTDSHSYRPSGWRGETLIYQESFGYGDHIGCMAFDYAAIKAQLDVRPNVTSARLRIERENTVHGDASAVLHLWSLSPGEVNASNILVKSGQPDLVNGSKEVGTNVYGRGDYEWETIDTAFIDRFRLETARGLALAQSETLSDPGDNNTDYAKFLGHDQTNKPILEFTCDF
jgi:hypothetical protein